MKRQGPESDTVVASRPRRILGGLAKFYVLVNSTVFFFAFFWTLSEQLS